MIWWLSVFVSWISMYFVVVEVCCRWESNVVIRWGMFLVCVRWWEENVLSKRSFLLVARV